MTKAVVNCRIIVENNAAELSNANVLSYYLEQELEELFNKAEDKTKMNNMLSLIHMIEEKCQIIEDNLYKLVDNMGDNYVQYN